MPPLTAIDAAWFAMDRRTNPMVITSVMWFDGVVDVDLLRELVASRLVARYPRFRQLVVRRGPRRRRCWEAAPGFDVATHVHHQRLGHPGDRAALQARVSELMSRPLPSDRPLWQVWLLEGQRTSAVVTRLHHCVADGVSLAHLLGSLSDGAAPPAPEPVPPATRPGLLETSVAWMRHPADLAPQLREIGREGVSLARLLLMLPDRRTALKGRLTGGKRAVWSEPVALADLKAAGHDLGATVNDLLLTAMSGALSRYLDAHGGAPTEIRAMVPFDLRGHGPGADTTLGNRFGMLVVPVPVGPVPPHDRLQTIIARTRDAKASPDGTVSASIIAALGLVPRLVEHVLVGVFSSKASVVVTNVPGPHEPVTLSGHRLLGVVGWAPASGTVSVTVTIVSYAGQVVLGVAADAAVVAHPEALVDGFHRELAALGAGGTQAEAEVPARGW